ncbi:MAG: non-ribosomal peptide synthetase [Acetatifactor sp.]|nr:non-ribosomal peptide synthetase [Acetatifactor sp.]
MERINGIIMIKTVQETLIEKLNDMDPEHVLITYGETEYSVREVKAQAGKIQNWIVRQGMEPGTSIALIIKDRELMIAGILGVLFARCVFVPFEHDMPSKVISEMMALAKIETILTDDLDLASEIGKGDDTRFDVNGLLKNDEIESSLTVMEYSGEDPIYAYFTSGTTGRPKAILGQNKGLAHFIGWESKKIGSTNQRVSQLTSPSHDPFLRDIFLPFFINGTICIPKNKAVILDGKALVRWIQASEINVIHCTPSLLNHALLACDSSVAVRNLRFLFLAGEKLTARLVDKCFDTLRGNYAIENLYGPTETTMAKLCYDVSEEDRNKENIPIGKPIDDTECYILDDDLRPCEQGEIYIRTSYGTLGYVNNDELNHKAFIRNPFDCQDKVLLYRTGDLGRISPDGNIEYLGRKDRQRKIRGNRVELSYVEEQIERIDGVRKCVVTYNDSTTGKEFLAAYIISNENYSGKRISDELLRRMPSYMVPAHYVFMDEFPMTANMKIDEKALPDPTRTVTEEISPVDAPGDFYESKISEICSDVLEVPSVDLDESYVSLGGTSLGVMTLISRIYEEFSVEMSLEDVLMSDSLRSMAEIIREKQGENADDTGVKDQRQKYSMEEYLNLSDSGNLKMLYEAVHGGKVTHVEPFNDIFYRSCINNAFISALKHWGQDELHILSNDLALYGAAEKGKVPERVKYLENRKLQELFADAGIEMQVLERSEDIVRDVAGVLNNDGLVVLGVDCYFESIRKDFYLKDHWPHNILVSGYDGHLKEVTVTEQTGINYLDYHEQKLSFLDMEYAYQSNLQRFPSFEDGKSFIALYQSSHEGKKDISHYYKSYTEYLRDSMDVVKKHLDNIRNIGVYLQERTQSLDEINKEYSNMVMLLDGIIDSKTAQAYVYERFIEISEEWSWGRDVMNEIGKAWKRIRNVIYKIKLTQSYEEESLMEAISGLDAVDHKERTFYDWTVNLIG